MKKYVVRGKTLIPIALVLVGLGLAFPGCNSSHRDERAEQIGALWVKFPKNITLDQEAKIRRCAMSVQEQWSLDFKRSVPVTTFHLTKDSSHLIRVCRNKSAVGCYEYQTHTMIVLFKDKWQSVLYHELIHAAFYHSTGGEKGPYGSRHTHPDWPRWESQAQQVASCIDEEVTK